MVHHHPGGDPRDHRRGGPRIQRRQHADPAFAPHALDEGRAGDGLHGLALLRHPARRGDPRHPRQHPGDRRRRRHDHRRLHDGQERQGPAGPGLLLRQLGLRRADHLDRRRSGHAPAGQAELLHPQRRDGGGDALRPHPDRRHRRGGHAQGADRRLLRPPDRGDRRRPDLLDAQGDLRISRTLRGRAAGPGAYRALRHLRGPGDDRQADHPDGRGKGAGRDRPAGPIPSRGWSSPPATGG